MILVIAAVLATRAVPQSASAGNAGLVYEPGGLALLVSYRATATQPADESQLGEAKPAPLATVKPEAPDLRAFDVSAIEAPSMPAYTVLESRVVFRSRDLHTRNGMSALAFKRHPGLLVGDAFNLNRNAAYEMFMEDDWRATKSDYWDMAHSIAQGGDRATGQKILEEINDEDLRMRAEAEEDAAAPGIGRFQIASAESGTKLLEMPEQTINIPFFRKTW
jgi:hypothetical protein